MLNVSVVQRHPFSLFFSGCPTKNGLPQKGFLFLRVTEQLRCALYDANKADDAVSMLGVDANADGKHGGVLPDMHLQFVLGYPSRKNSRTNTHYPDGGDIPFGKFADTVSCLVLNPFNPKIEALNNGGCPL